MRVLGISRALRCAYLYVYSQVGSYYAVVTLLRLTATYPAAATRSNDELLLDVTFRCC